MANRFPRRRRDRPGKSPRTQSLFLERFGGERLEQRRVMDASSVALWEEAPAVLSETVRLDGGFTATANAQSGDFTFTTNNGEVTITGFTGSRVVEIPAKIEGLPVRAIGDFAFSGKLHQSNIEIPDSVTSIGSFAFADCINLMQITIPASVTSIGESAFNCCRSLTSIAIQTGVMSIGRFAFADCTSLTSVTIPDSVTSIEDYAFDSCVSLASVIIPDSVTSIGRSVFGGCTSLTSVTIPANLTGIDDYVFSESTSLVEYDPSQDNIDVTFFTLENSPYDCGLRILFADNEVSVEVPLADASPTPPQATPVVVFDPALAFAAFAAEPSEQPTTKRKSM
jgi:hypothetical protein